MKKVVTGNDGGIKYIDSDEIVIQEKLTIKDYNKRVEELINNTYTIDAQGSFLANWLRVKDGIERDSEKIKQYTDEYFSFQSFRNQCKIQARKDCNII